MPINLKKLQNKNLPHATIESLPLELKWSGKDGRTKEAKKAKEKFIKVMNNYLYDFLPSQKDVPCVNCSEPQAGIFGCFQWGLAHGEGYCSKCGYPARGCHYPDRIVTSWEGSGRLNLILQYHPNVLKGGKNE